MITYTIRLHNCKNKLGDEWYNVENTDIWIYELGSLNEHERDHRIIKFLSEFTSDFFGDSEMSLFVNMYEDLMGQPVKFSLNILTYLHNHKCSIELWK
jgi:hypothetical protein